MRWSVSAWRPPALPPKLATLCAILGVLAAAEMASGAPQQAAAQAAGNVAPSPPAQDEPVQDFSLPSVTSFSEVIQRPLFNATRRPALAADQSGQAWSSFILKGVILSPTTREALLLHNKQAALVSLREGEMLDGWIAEAILPDRVVFRNGGEEQELTLVKAGNSQAPIELTPIALPAQPPSRPQPPSF